MGHLRTAKEIRRDHYILNKFEPKMINKKTVEYQKELRATNNELMSRKKEQYDTRYQMERESITKNRLRKLEIVDLERQRKTKPIRERLNQLEKEEADYKKSMTRKEEEVKDFVSHYAKNSDADNYIKLQPNQERNYHFLVSTTTISKKLRTKYSEVEILTSKAQDMEQIVFDLIFALPNLTNIHKGKIRVKYRVSPENGPSYIDYIQTKMFYFRNPKLEDISKILINDEKYKVNETILNFEIISTDWNKDKTGSCHIETPPYLKMHVLNPKVKTHCGQCILILKGLSKAYAQKQCISKTLIDKAREIDEREELTMDELFELSDVDMNIYVFNKEYLTAKGAVSKVLFTHYPYTGKSNPIDIVLYNNHYMLIKDLNKFKASKKIAIVKDSETCLQCDGCEYQANRYELDLHQIPHDKRHSTKCVVPIKYKNCIHVCKKKGDPCPICKKVVVNMQEHNESDCRVERECANCKAFFHGKHSCDLIKRKKKSKTYHTFVWDIESYYSEGVQEVAMIVCRDTDEYVFYSDDEFIEFLHSLDKEKKYLFLAHNSRSYDTIVMMKAFERSGSVSNICKPGARYYSITYNGHILFRDSQLHMNRPLDQLHELFDLDVQKGEFDYKSLVKGLPRDHPIMLECLKYCKLDVEVLYQSVTKYREMMVDITDEDPWSYMTLTSYVINMYFNDHYLNHANTKLELTRKQKMAYLQDEDIDLVQDAFFGGRCESFKDRYVCKEGETLEMLDVVSLYPTVQYYDLLPGSMVGRINKTMVYPRTHAYLSKLASDNLVGFFVCDIECPKDLEIPVLPERGKKLMFTLVDKNNASYYSAELMLAIRKGYRITQITSGLVFEGTDQLFKSYIEKYYKVKQNNVGAKRNLGKMMLNSVWGYLAMKYMPEQNEFVNDDLYLKLLRAEDDMIVDIKEAEAMEQSIYVKHLRFDSDMVRSHTLQVAAAVTSCARVRLYEMLDLRGSDSLYCDTDSVLFVKKDSEVFVNEELDIAIGGWVSEFPGKTATEFYCSGSKCYSIHDSTGSVIKKSSKGVRTSDVSQYDIKDIVVGSVFKEYDSVLFKKTFKDVTVCDRKKIMKYTNDKRIYVLDEGLSYSLPYGFVLD